MAQVDSSTNKLMNELDNKAAKPQGKTPVKFLAQRLINANTVETLQKGHFEFKVVHNFGDASGRNGGIRSAFGLDGSVDIKIAFLYGITKTSTLSYPEIKEMARYLHSGSWVLNINFLNNGKMTHHILFRWLYLQMVSVHRKDQAQIQQEKIITGRHQIDRARPCN